MPREPNSSKFPTRISDAEETARWQALMARQGQPEPLLEAARCQALWGAMLHQAASDILNAKTDKEAAFEVHRIRAWINTKRFDDACDLAGFDVDATRAFFARLLAGEVADARRVFGCGGKNSWRDDKPETVSTGRKRRGRPRLQEREARRGA